MASMEIKRKYRLLHSGVDTTLMCLRITATAGCQRPVPDRSYAGHVSRPTTRRRPRVCLFGRNVGGGYIFGRRECLGCSRLGRRDGCRGRCQGGASRYSSSVRCLAKGTRVLDSYRRVLENLVAKKGCNGSLFLPCHTICRLFYTCVYCVFPSLFGSM